MPRVPSIVWIVFVLVLVGCGRSKEEVPPATFPQGAIATDLPSVPEEAPVETPIELPEASSSQDVASLITPKVHNQFVRGMNLSAARSLLAIEPESVGGEGGDTAIYRWEDETGTYFTARFEKDVLVVRSALRQRQASPPSTAPQAAMEIDGNPVAEVAPGVYVPLERAIRSSVEQARGVSAPPMPAPVPQGPRSVLTVPAAPGPTVVVAGAARREREASAEDLDSSYRPRARLPEFTHGFSPGRYEIRFVNPTDGPMSVGLRQDKLGEDLDLPAKGQASIHVDRGIYEIYFVMEEDPDALYEAEPLNLDGFHASDVAVQLSPDNVSVTAIDYSLPE